MDRKESKVKFKLMLTIFFIFIFSGAFIVYNQYQDLNSNVFNQMEKLNQLVKQNYIVRLEKLKETTSVQTDVMLSKEGLAEAFANGDREKLYQYSKHFYTYFQKQNKYLKIMTFRLQDGTTFLRTHKPEMYGDKLNKSRKIIIATNETQKRQYGFEIGKLKMTYRVVTPIFYNNKHIGLVEFGIDPEYLTKDLEDIFQTKYALIVKKDDTQVLLDKSKIEKSQNNHGYVLAKSDEIFKKLFYKVDIKQQKNIIDFNDTKYSIYTNIDLLDYENKSTAKILLAYDMKSYIEKTNQLFLNSVIKISIMIIVVFMVLNYGFNYFIKSIEEQQAQLEELNENLELKVESRTEELKENFKQLEMAQIEINNTSNLASLGRMVAGISHEINTPVGLSLTGITYLQDETNKLVQLYNSDKMSEDDFTDYLKNSNEIIGSININLNKAAHLVRSFKQVAVDQSSHEVRLFNLKDYIDDILLSIHHITKKVKFKLNIQINIDEKLTINSTPGSFSQIITNMIINSIIHGFKNYESDKIGNIVIGAYIEDDILYFEYKDDGLGLNNKHLNKLFEPFFTTNRDNGGSGLGTHILHNIIVENLKGEIKAFSEPNRGLLYKITIPLK